MVVGTVVVIAEVDGRARVEAGLWLLDRALRSSMMFGRSGRFGVALR